MSDYIFFFEKIMSDKNSPFLDIKILVINKIQIENEIKNCRIKIA